MFFIFDAKMLFPVVFCFVGGFLGMLVSVGIALLFPHAPEWLIYSFPIVGGLYGFKSGLDGMSLM